MPNDQVSDRIRALPDRPGIYVFLGEGQRALYVGKAKSLRKRGGSYLGAVDEPRIARMLREAVDLDFVVTDNESEALLLENNWIKQKKPRYNVLLRDDKTYPYVKLTTQDEYPRVVFTRRIRDDGAEYFGPYLPGGLARKAIKLVQKLFQIRICRIPIDGSLPRPCLYHDMNRCLGPCVDGLTSRSIYAEAVDDARLFLSGRTRELVARIRSAMESASAGEEFEEAARLRDILAEVAALVGPRQNLSTVYGEDVDIFGVCARGGKASVTILVMRGGQVLDRRDLFWEREDEVSPQSLLSELLPQLYSRTTFIPKEIHLPFPIDGDEALVEWLSSRKEERVYLRLPSRGPKARRVELAARNAELAFGRRFREGDAALDGLTRLQEHLHLSELPRRIEAFDISTLQGEDTVASLAVWEGRGLRKSDYRSFNIRGLDGQDDFAAIRQAVERRYRRILEEVGSMPDMLLIDGGRGQLNAALDALASLGVEETPVVALAKKEEELWIPAVPEPLRLPRTDPGLKVLQSLRDEAHRFALDRHRRRRRSRALRSKFDDIPGIGPSRKRKLITTFGSLDAVRGAELQQLQAVLGPSLGRNLFEYFRSDPNTDGSARIG